VKTSSAPKFALAENPTAIFSLISLANPSSIK